MHSLSQEIQGFSLTRLRRQCTHVTTVTGRRLLETRSAGGEGPLEQVEELEQQQGAGCGFIEDTSLDLQIGVVRPFLLLGTLCDTCHEVRTLAPYGPVQVNKTTGMSWSLHYASELTLCVWFLQDGVVLVHCNAGVSRSPSVVIGYLMIREGLSFDDAFSQVKQARPSSRPNSGFYQQLQNFECEELQSPF
uniref:Dual specificity phosphatase 19b n=1 Tax=Oryzias sinensis TaxID=183150 RepID=A0A8C7Y4E2_9TELE